MGGGGEALIAGIAAGAGAGDGGDGSVGGHFADAGEAGVGDEEIAGGIDCQAADGIELGVRGGASIPGKSGRGGAGGGAERSIGGELMEKQGAKREER